MPKRKRKASTFRPNFEAMAPIVAMVARGESADACVAFQEVCASMVGLKDFEAFMLGRHVNKLGNRHWALGFKGVVTRSPICANVTPDMLEARYGRDLHSYN